MSNVDSLKNQLNLIGDAIRRKTNKSELLSLDSMVTEINNLSSEEFYVLKFGSTSAGTSSASKSLSLSAGTYNVVYSGGFTGSDKYNVPHPTLFVNKVQTPVTIDVDYANSTGGDGYRGCYLGGRFQFTLTKDAKIQLKCLVHNNTDHYGAIDYYNHQYTAYIYRPKSDEITDTTGITVYTGNNWAMTGVLNYHIDRASGQYIEDIGFNTTPKIDVSTNTDKSLVVSGITWSSVNSGYRFTDADGTILSYGYISSTSTTTLTIPDNAKYFEVSFRDYSDGDDTETVHIQFNSTSPNIITPLDYVDVVYTSTTWANSGTLGYYINNANGANASASNWGITPPVDISGATSIIYGGLISANDVTGYRFTDASGTIVSYGKSLNGENELTIPKNAKYFEVTFCRGDGEASLVYIKYTRVSS